MLMKPNFEADGIDWKILNILQRNARTSNTEIGRLVGLSQPAVTVRIGALEEAGVIEAYCARVNPRALGQEITALIRLRTTHEKIKECLRTFEGIPEILEVYRTTGEDCFMIKASFAQMPKLEATIDALAKFGSVTTSLVLATYAQKPLTKS